MNQFLSILLRNQFNLFYRFGYTFIPKYQLVEFGGSITNDTQESIIEKFKIVTPFEYDEEYLILHLEKTVKDEDEFVQFAINDIVAVYPLSQQAKISIESKLDQRIRLEKPIFESILPTIETEIDNKEVEKAISALWTICNIESSLENYVTNIGLEYIFSGLEFRKHGTKAYKIQSGNYWEYLIAYDRLDYFPNSTLGYFYDAGQVFAFSKGLQSFEGSGAHRFLESLNSENPTAKLPDIIKHLEIEEQLKSYVYQTTIGDIKQYIVAPLYLMLRDEIRNSDDIVQTKLFKNLDYLKTFGDSFNYVLVLLAGFFGYRKFYDLHYDYLNLRIFKIKSKETNNGKDSNERDTSSEFTSVKIAPRLKSALGGRKINGMNDEPAKVAKGTKKPRKSTDIATTEARSPEKQEIQEFILEMFVEKNDILFKDILDSIRAKTGQKVKVSDLDKLINDIDELVVDGKGNQRTARKVTRH